MTALGGLLHGEGAHGPRFEKFASSVRIWDAEGQGRKVTWPLATLLQALYAPAQHTFVKPTVFEQQALVLNLTADKHAPVTSTTYESFLDVARKTAERLTAAGHPPRDLMDVYSFIWRSHKEQPAAWSRASSPSSPPPAIGPARGSIVEQSGKFFRTPGCCFFSVRRDEAVLVEPATRSLFGDRRSTPQNYRKRPDTVRRRPTRRAVAFRLLWALPVWGGRR